MPYVNSLLTVDPPVAPLDRLAREAVHGARTAMRGKRPEVIDAAVRSALRETVFRFELVMKINVMVHDLVDRERLIDAALSAQVALVAAEAKPTPKGVERLRRLRDQLVSRVSELRAAAESRTLLEERYLDGHGALFPDIAAAFAEQLHQSQEIAVPAMRAAELDGVEPAPPDDPDALALRAPELIADLVERPSPRLSTSSARDAKRSRSLPTGYGRRRRRGRSPRRRRSEREGAVIAAEPVTDRSRLDGQPIFGLDGEANSATRSG
ncbi:MAG: hypothetical protein ACHQ01_06925 [Candidatus Limnocylindrales bacterium]